MQRFRAAFIIFGESICRSLMCDSVHTAGPEKLTFAVFGEASTAPFLSQPRILANHS
jgi:hypothetical protein